MNIRKSNYISNAFTISDMSLKFETLYQDNRVQNFFKSLNILGDFLSCQALMSHSLARLTNGKSDFSVQRVFLQE